MAASDTVVGALLSMFETDYRGALRSLITSVNPQMSEDEVRRRVQLQAEYQPQEVAVARLRAWVEDGIVSRPDLVGGVVRRITAPARATPA